MEGRQDVCLFSRKRMELCGIEEVEGFTEEQIVLSSLLGMIAIEGKKLKIESFSMEAGELKINGEIDSVYYYEKSGNGEKRGMLARLFK